MKSMTGTGAVVGGTQRRNAHGSQGNKRRPQPHMPYPSLSGNTPSSSNPGPEEFKSQDYYKKQTKQSRAFGKPPTFSEHTDGESAMPNIQSAMQGGIGQSSDEADSPLLKTANNEELFYDANENGD